MSAATKAIGGRTYSFGVIPPTEAIFVELAVASVIGEALFQMLVNKKTASDEQNMQAVGSAMGVIAAKMDPEKLVATMGTVFKYVGCDGKASLNLDLDFHGRNKDVWLVFVAALRENFGDFMPAGLSASVSKLAAA